MRNSARSPTPAAVPGCGRRGMWMRIFGGSPLSTSSHSAGVAINSPSRSRPVMSAITVAGRPAVSATFLPCLTIVPASARSRRMRFNSARSAFLRPNSRAISLVPAFPGFARMKATMASLLGKPLSRSLFTLPSSPGFSGALLRRRLCGGGRLGSRGLRGRSNRRARLADGFRLRLGGGLLHRGFLRRLRRFVFGFRLDGFSRLARCLAGRLVGFLGRLFGLYLFGLCFFGLGLLDFLDLAAALGRALVDQCDRLGQRNRILFLVAR